MYQVTRNGKTCNCYVGHLAEIDQMELRYGAHLPKCPVYRESGDPVDRENDHRVRIEYTRALQG